MEMHMRLSNIARHATFGSKRPGALLTVAIIVALALLSAACKDEQDSSPSIVLGESGVSVNGEVWEYRGSAMSREILMPDASLTDTKGAAFDLREQTQGVVTLLYVGYTNCPDLCPTHMAEIARALKDLPAEAQSDVKVIFLTSDPRRDTPDVLSEWLARFDPSFIGLTGVPEELVKVQQDLGMNPATIEAGAGQQEYSVNHASYVLAFPADSRTALIAYPAGATYEDYLADLRRLTSTP
jgi:protein SCO1/2